jgi:hypothetical protein
MLTEGNKPRSRRVKEIHSLTDTALATRTLLHFYSVIHMVLLPRCVQASDRSQTSGAM